MLTTCNKTPYFGVVTGGIVSSVEYGHVQSTKISACSIMSGSIDVDNISVGVLSADALAITAIQPPYPTPPNCSTGIFYGQDCSGGAVGPYQSIAPIFRDCVKQHVVGNVLAADIPENWPNNRIVVTASDINAPYGIRENPLGLVINSGALATIEEDAMKIITASDFVVDGRLFNAFTSDFALRSNVIYLNSGYTDSSTPQSGGMLINRLPLNNLANISQLGFRAAGVDSPNPRIYLGPSPIPTFAVGDFVQVSGTPDKKNTGIYQVKIIAGNLSYIDIEGDPLIAEFFVQTTLNTVDFADTVHSAGPFGYIVGVNVSFIGANSISGHLQNLVGSSVSSLSEVAFLTTLVPATDDIQITPTLSGYSIGVGSTASIDATNLVIAGQVSYAASFPGGTQSECTIIGKGVTPLLYPGMIGGNTSVGYDAGRQPTAGGNVAVGLQAGQTGQNGNAVAVGYQAGRTSQSDSSVAIGSQAGQTDQGSVADILGNVGKAISIGDNAGVEAQGYASIAIGHNAGRVVQKSRSISIGLYAGFDYQDTGSIAIGYESGYNNQGPDTIALGTGAGRNGQNLSAIAIGTGAGGASQGILSIAIGSGAGSVSQRESAIAIGELAGSEHQGLQGIAIGIEAGRLTQSEFSVAIGGYAATLSQGKNSTAIGTNAGRVSQLDNSVAIGFNAGTLNQQENSVGIGAHSVENSQRKNSVAIGYQCVRGLTSVQSQGESSVAIGANCAIYGQGNYCVSIGSNSATGLSNGTNNQQDYAIAIGYNAGSYASPLSQYQYSVAIGANCRPPQNTGRLGFGNNMEPIEAIGDTREVPAGLLTMEWNGVPYKIPVLSNTATSTYYKNDPIAIGNLYYEDYTSGYPTTSSHSPGGQIIGPSTIVLTGSSNLDSEQYFSTTPTKGEIRYEGLSINYPIVSDTFFYVSFAVSASSAANQDLQFYLKKNGTAIPGSSFHFRATVSGAIFTISGNTVITMVTSDIISLWAANTTAGASEIIIHNVNLSLVGSGSLA